MGNVIEEAFDAIGKLNVIISTLKNEIVSLNGVIQQKDQRNQERSDNATNNNHPTPYD